jgi:hypothetical protein
MVHGHVIHVRQKIHPRMRILLSASTIIQDKLTLSTFVRFDELTGALIQYPFRVIRVFTL